MRKHTVVYGAYETEEVDAVIARLKAGLARAVKEREIAVTTVSLDTVRIKEENGRLFDALKSLVDRIGDTPAFGGDLAESISHAAVIGGIGNARKAMKRVGSGE